MVLQEGNADAIIESLQKRSFDVAIARYPMRAASGVVMRLIEKDRFCAALPLGHRLATLKQIRLQALADETFLVPTASHNPALHGLVIQACQVAGFMPRLAQEEAVQLSTVLALVEGGFGVALIPEGVARAVRRNVVFVRLSGTSASLETGLGLLHLEGPQSPRVTLFRDAVLSLKPVR